MKNFDFDFLEKREFNLKLFVLIFVIMAVSIYIGFLIYGNRGLNTLIDLQNNKQIMSKRVNQLKQENVKLQREYFGLKDIEGDK